MNIVVHLLYHTAATSPNSSIHSK